MEWLFSPGVSSNINKQYGRPMLCPQWNTLEKTQRREVIMSYDTFSRSTMTVVLLQSSPSCINLSRFDMPDKSQRAIDVIQTVVLWSGLIQL